MAQKNKMSQAEKAASEAKKKNQTAVKNSQSKESDKKKSEKECEQISLEMAPAIPVRAVTSIICISMFILFLVIFLKPDGTLLQLIRSFLFGIIGKAAFYVSIPALLYLFIIQAFSGKRPVLMRSICVIAFVYIFGCIAHLCLNPKDLSSGFALVADLYQGGIRGTTGGVLCGLVAGCLKYLLGSVLPFILLGIVGVLVLMGSFQITVPSIIRAVNNRPRAQWELDKEHKPEVDPAEIVVNKIATKRIEHVERKRNQLSQPVHADEPQKPQDNKKKLAAVSDLMRQIGSDVSAPVAAAGKSIDPDPEEEDDILSSPAAQQVPQSSPKEIPAAPAEREIPFMADEPASEPQPEGKPEPEMDIPAAEVPVKPAAPDSVQPAASGKVSRKDAQESAAEVAREIEKRENEKGEAEDRPEYSFPPIELLKRPRGTNSDGTEEMRENSRRLNETLASFNIAAHIVNVTRGPSVTRYEVELEKGVKLSKLTNCADDIALSLGASGVRIAAVPGKISVVGIEVPNRTVTTVSLRDVIDSREFSGASSKSSFAVGKDIGGSCIVGNIAKLPHMLIAGTTGSGKSVCMNSIIISLLYKASPDDVKLIMVDPKMVELGIYNGIPHLLIPVVTDPKKAAGSLQWAVTEMMRRYKAMSDAGVRDLESYNSIMESEGEDAQKLPQVVVIIDELADLMLVAAKEVEESICRIAQMGRAAGIHLIIATQRPSADVITGLMKANIPSRIAFAVASAMESRIILDTQGAEKLVGKGDMLYAPIGCGKPKRVQGCFVSDAEVEAVATFVKEHYNTDYDESIMEDIEKAAQAGSKPSAQEPESNADEMAGDEMLPAAVDVILETGQASVSMLQRRLKLGYARAARIVDEMEERGIVGPFKGSKPREILITREQWESMKNGVQGQQLAFDDLSSDDSSIPDEIE